ncbi:hypothetical protein FHX77_000745 [Bifidobacterium commune]|uniref:Intracellular septation protein A n=1 Tax=Bifidobacterium commune TaxID=1505727 RepID=A0A1C4H071_9BIFI|nr:DUF3159 domain-containing protein [Bifidobacterium commune]MBB2955337.1 hypothetical protein [Bifidobacterium commune]SCC78323.1 Protein of unknown function [Bifidobacterium commune]
MTDAKKPQGLAALAGVTNGEDFSVVDAIGGIRGVIESMLPGFLFVFMFVLTSNLKLTVIASAVLAVLSVLIRFFQRQTVLGALAGLFSIAICLVWAWNTNEARNYYVYGFITNSICVVVLVLSFLVRVPGIGFFIEFIRSMPTEHYRAWLADWRGDKRLLQAYNIVTAMWIVIPVLRLAVQVPLYLADSIAWLGTARLLMGLPFTALSIWISYLIIADPMRNHPKYKSDDNIEEDADGSTNTDVAQRIDDGEDDDLHGMEGQDHMRHTDKGQR